MIPKKIHFTWFSNDPYPELVKNCMASWKEMLPDYEFIHWDMEMIGIIDNLFLRQALQVKKWAFAADFVRLYALYTQGGIYLDTDVVVYKSFNELLQLRAFIGKESSFHVRHRRATRYLTSHCMGAEKGHPFIKSCLDYYKDRPFILTKEDWLPDTLKYDQTILPFIQTEIAKFYGYHPSDSIKGIQRIDDDVLLFPSDYFDSQYRTSNSYCRHLAMAGWRGGNPSLAESSRYKARRITHLVSSKVAEMLGYAFFKKI